MNKMAKFYRNKFFRNGIAAAIGFFTLSYAHFNHNRNYELLLVIFAICSIWWLSAAFWINNHLKNRKNTIDAMDSSGYRTKQIAFELFFALCVVLSIRRIAFSDTLLITGSILYSVWLLSRFRSIYYYFKSFTN